MVFLYMQCTHTHTNTISTEDAHTHTSSGNTGTAVCQLLLRFLISRRHPVSLSLFLSITLSPHNTPYHNSTHAHAHIRFSYSFCAIVLFNVLLLLWFPCFLRTFAFLAAFTLPTPAYVCARGGEQASESSTKSAVRAYTQRGERARKMPERRFCFATFALTHMHAHQTTSLPSPLLRCSFTKRDDVGGGKKEAEKI